MLATLGVGIGLVLAAALAAERSAAGLHNVHLAAVAAALVWLMFFAARGHR